LTPFLDKFNPKSTVQAFGESLGVRFDSPTKVLHLAAGNLFGGIERMLISLALNAHYCPGLIQSFGVCFPGRLAQELRSKNFSVCEFGKASFRNPLSLFFARKQFRKFLDANHFDWIVCHGSWIHALFGKIILKSGSQLVHMVHGISNGLSLNDRWCQKNPPNLVMANSRATVGFANLLFPGVRTSVVYPPCDLTPCADRSSLRNNWRRKYGISSGQFVIFAASRMEAGKGLDILIESLGLIKENPNWICWIGGEAQRHSDRVYLNILRKFALREGVDSKIRWLGHVHDILGHFAAADLYCQPNRLPESFGMTFVEAQSMGCPVITTGFGGALEVVECHQRNQLLPYPSAESVAEAILNVIQSEKRI
jgi:glycosyltransferase involved in cell wall biosynthesis